MSGKNQTIIEEIIHKLNDYNNEKVLFIQRTKFRQRSWTKKDLVTIINALIDFHSQKKLNSNDKIIICAPNSPLWGCVFFACAIKNIVIVPLDFNSSEDFINSIIKKTKPKLLYISRYKEIKISGELEKKYIEDIEDQVSLDYSKTILPIPEISPERLLEIVFTSGSTGHPKGTMISYENITSNIHNLLKVMTFPKENKFLSIIPLSHMLEQNVGFLTPLKLGFVVVYPYILTPTEIIQALSENHITAVVCVPAFIKLIKDSIEREVSKKNKLKQFYFFLSIAKHMLFKTRRLLFGELHNNLGGKLAEFFIGGAPLDPIIEDFWENVGVKVTQGYGLTECSPLVTMNTGTFYKKYSVGRCVPNQEIKLLPDGEILVKGKNVSSGYYKEPELTHEVFKDNWFYTGDLGELDADGNLFIKGRKKNVIVNTAGMKIYPEDIEIKLNQFPQIKDSVVVGLEEHNAVIITAVIISKSLSIDTKIIIEKVNAELASHQKIQKVIMWKEDDFPRTSTRKIKRFALLEKLQSAGEDSNKTKTKNSRDVLIKILSELSAIPEEKITPKTNLVLDLQLDSIKKLELISRVQEEMQGYIDEQTINQYATVEDLKKNIKPTQNYQKISFPSWQMNRITNITRMFLQAPFFILLNSFQKIHIRIKKNVHYNLPVIFIANHTSHLDAPTVLKSLPTAIRKQTCIAAAKDYFFENKFFGFSVRLLLNAFPIDREKNITETLKTIGTLLNNGNSILIFPEGTRSLDGNIGPFKNGIGVLAQEMAVPIVPIKIKGNFEILPKGKQTPVKGKTEVIFGDPVPVKKSLSYIDTVAIIEQALRNLQ